jgi:glutamine synthetase
LALPPRPDASFWALSEEARAAAGVRQLPHSLDAALDELAATPQAKDWFGERFLDAYLMFKRSEIEALIGLDDAAICARYAEVY